MVSTSRRARKRPIVSQRYGDSTVYDVFVTFWSVSTRVCDPNAWLSATMARVNEPVIESPLRDVLQFEIVSVALCRWADPDSVRVPPLTDPDALIRNDATSTLP